MSLPRAIEFLQEIELRPLPVTFSLSSTNEKHIKKKSIIFISRVWTTSFGDKLGTKYNDAARNRTVLRRNKQEQPHFHSHRASS
jgi:hypothetical protein